MARHAGNVLRKLRKDNGLSQREFAEAININVGILSQIEKGHRPLSERYLAKIKEAYLFDDGQLSLITEQAGIDLVREKFGLDWSNRVQAPLEEFELVLAGLKSTRLKGNTHNKEVIGNFIERLTDYWFRYPSDRRRIERLMCEFLIERIESTVEITPEHRIKKSTRQDLDKLSWHIEILKDQERGSYELALTLPMSVNYVAKNMHEVLESIQQLATQSVTPHARALYRRNSLVATAHLFTAGKLEKVKATTDFLQGEDSANEMLSNDSLDSNSRAMLLEGISVTRSILDLPESQKPLNEAMVAYENSFLDGSNRALTRASITRTELRNMIRNEKLEPEFVKRQVELRISVLSHYVRYKEQIINELLRHKNPELRDFGSYLRIARI